MYHHGGAAAVCTRDEERELGARVAGGDLEARDELIRRNLGLVCTIARRYRRYGDEEDLRQAGALGLTQAVDRWEVERGVKFGTFASDWIRMEILASIDRSSLVHVPNYQRYPPPRERRYASPRRAATAAHAVACAAEAMRPHLYFRVDGSAGDSRAAEEGRVLPPPDPDAGSAEAAIDDEDERHLLSDLLARLTATEQLVLRRRYGLDLRPACTLRDLAGDLGLTREGVRQIESRAVSKLRELAAEHVPPPRRDPCRGRDAHRHCACDPRLNPNRPGS